MNEVQLQWIWRFTTIAIIVIIIVIVWAIVVWGIFLPIKKKDDHLKKLNEGDKELQHLHAQIAAEWDNHKRITEENSKMRKALTTLREDKSKIEEEIAAEKVQKEKLVNIIRELKKEIPKDTPAATT